MNPGKGDPSLLNATIVSPLPGLTKSWANEDPWLPPMGYKPVAPARGSQAYPRRRSVASRPS